jgi:hypothetical protein
MGTYIQYRNKSDKIHFKIHIKKLISFLFNNIYFVKREDIGQKQKGMGLYLGHLDYHNLKLLARGGGLDWEESVG